MPELNIQDELWLKLRKECDVAAFSRIGARDIIAGKYEEAIKNNYLPFYLEWYYQKPLLQLNLDQIICALKDILEASNIFKSITVQQLEQNAIRMIGYIGMNYETSEFYARYISYFLEKYCNCKVKSSITQNGITLDIIRLGK